MAGCILWYTANIRELDLQIVRVDHLWFYDDPFKDHLIKQVLKCLVEHESGEKLSSSLALRPGLRNLDTCY